MPVRAAGGDIVDIKDQVREALIENAGLHLEGNLRGDERGFDVAEGAEAARGENDGHQQGERGAGDGEQADGDEDAFSADAQRGEGDDFAVHGHAAEAEQNADKHGHGDGEDEDAWDDAKEESDDLGAGAGVADEQLHQADEFGHEKYEGEDEESQESVADNFPNNIAIEDAHDAKRECNMGRERRADGSSLSAIS